MALLERRTVMLWGDQQLKQLTTKSLPPSQGKAVVQRGWQEEEGPTPQTSMVWWGEGRR